MKLEDELDIWLRSYKLSNVFPREVGLNRRVAKDEVDFYDYLNFIKWTDGYSNVWANWQKSRRKFDTVLIDIDVHDNSLGYDEQVFEAYEVMGKVRDILEKEGLAGRWYFSGRGYHVYIDVPLTHLELYSEVVRYNWGSKVFKSVLDYIDRRVLGNKNVMARLPGTINSKTRLYMVRIEPEWEIAKILSNALEGRFPDSYEDVAEKNSWLVDEFKSIEEKIVEKKSYKQVGNEFNREDEVKRLMEEYSNLESLPPCVAEGIRTLIETGELVHEWRLHIASYLLRVWDYDEVVRVFMFADDFNKRMTEYQLNYILKHDLYPYSCRNAKMLGICPMKDIKRCPWYSLTDGWLGRPFKEAKENDES